MTGFVLALVIVTFLHLVVGEMAPKSWAIAHPEKSATMLAIPMRAFMWAFRPLLRMLNGAANWCLHRVGVDPVDQLAGGQNPEDLRHLVEHSANVGALDASYSAQLSGALELETLTVADLVVPGVRPSAVATGATAADVRSVALDSGHRRILVGTDTEVWGIVHVRDTLPVAAGTPVTDLMRPAYFLPADTAVYTALTRMRESSTQLALLTDGGVVIGVVSIVDLLERLFPVIEQAV